MSSQGDLTAAKRFLVVSNDWQSEVEPAQKLVGDVYTVVTLADAKNGLLRSLQGKQAILWPSATLQSQEFMREFSLELIGHCKQVKFLDSSSLPMFTPSYMIEGDWTWETFKDFAAPLLHEISEGDDCAPSPAGIVAAPSVPNSAAQTQVSPDLPPDSQDRAASASPDSPVGMEASERAEPISTLVKLVRDKGPEFYTSAPEFEPVPYGSPDEPPQWAQEFAPPDAVRQLTASEAYIGYIEPENAWPEPLDLSDQLYVAAPLDLALIPASLRPIVGDFSKRTGIDPAPAFFGFLGAIAGVSSDTIKLQPKQKDTRWRVHPTLWPIAIGGSSSGKSPAIEEGMQFVIAKDRALVTENAKKRKDYQHSLDMYADDCAIARKNKAARPEEPPPPILREYWVNRGTTEGITRHLEHSPKAMVYIDEVSTVINAMDRYAAGGKGSGDREFWLMLWNGGPAKNSLAGKTITIDNASAVICGGTTPTAMRQAAGNKLQSDGFLQRTLLCMVPNKRNGTDSEPDNSAYAQYDAMLDYIINMPGNATLKFSHEAQEVYNKFCEEIDRRIQVEDNEPLQAHLGKWAGLFPRIALVYSIIEAAHNKQWLKDGHTVSADIGEQVRSFLMDFQMSHICYFWNELMSDKGSRRFSQTITRYIIANPQLKDLNFRDHIARPHWREMEQLKPWELKDAINTLITAAWIVPNGSKNNSHGVPSSYQINPRIEGMFTEERSREVEMRMVKRDELQRLRDAKRNREPGEDD